MVLVLVLSCVLAVSADVLHEDITFTACSDSEREKMVGLDDEEIWFADFNKEVGVDAQPDFVDHVSFEGVYQSAVAQTEICKRNLGISRKAMKDEKEKKDAPPIPIVYPKDEVELGQKNFLVCFVGPFYPAPVKISWKKNGENVTAGITYNVPLLNQDWTLKQFSKLEFTPQLGDIYSCSVDHVALDQPQTRIYDVKQTGPGVGPAVFCGLGLTVGLLGVAAGTFFLIKGNECS